MAWLKWKWNFEVKIRLNITFMFYTIKFELDVMLPYQSKRCT